MKRRAMLNIMVVTALLLSIVPLSALAIPVASPNGSTLAQTGDNPFKPIVSQPVSPAKTDGLPAAPIVKTVPVRKDFEPDRGYNQPLPRAAGQANPTGDAALQTQPGAVNMPAPVVNFEALNNISGYYPPDTNGEVGPHHYVQMVNVSMAVYDKSGNLLYGPFFPHTLWPSGDVCNGPDNGDPVVLYDQFADRWLVTQFALPNYPNGPFYECIAVSKTGTPTNVPSDWYPYTFQVHATKMDDYPKLSVWPDGYYMTVNQFNPNWAGAGVFAFDRAKMLNGQAATFQYFDLYGVNTNFGGMLPADVDGNNPPPAGSPAYFFEVDDNVGSPSLGAADAMRIWKFHVDWTTPANTTFGLSGQPNFVLPVASFDLLPCVINGVQCIPQPGTSQKLDSLGDRLMFRAAYRNFGDHESVVFNHTVLADSTDRAGVRWYEVRGLSSTPAIYQQGTYAPADGQYRWMGSVAMDHVGNIAAGYSVASTTVYPSIRYAGRLTTDPLGTLPQAEANIITGSGSQTGSAGRWGDYSDMTVDPIDDCTFWYTQEYIQTTGTVSWQTRVASFKFPNCALGPQGMLAGVVTNAATSAPVVGAAIQATASITQSGATASVAGGQYSMLLLTGSYTVTASAYGYQPTTITGVNITVNTTTTQNISLTPSAMYVVSGTVTDASAGWPLYAKITIPEWPGGSIWTDPVTGFYSVTLAAGITHTFQVSAWASGYLPNTTVLAPLSGNTTRNLQLNANLVSCQAPGYQLGINGLYENFDSTATPALPTGWATAAITSTDGLWATNVGTKHPSGVAAHSGANLAYFNSYTVSSGHASRLYRTAGLNMTTVPTTTLSFWVYHDTGYSTSDDNVQVQVSTNGTVWQNVGAAVSRYDGTTGWAQHTVNLSAYAAATSLQLGFLGTSAYGNDIHLDDVLLGTITCLPQTGGLIVGNVLDKNTTVALNDVKVSRAGASTTSVATTDPANPAGFYLLFAPAGSATITATLSKYEPVIANKTIVAGTTVRQDFLLPAGRLVYSPNALQATLMLGANSTTPFTLTNNGTASTAYEIKELSKGFDSSLIGPYQHAGFVVKPFRQQFKTAVGLSGIGTLPSAPPYAAGDVIQSWPSGLVLAWGIAYDGNDSTVWVSSPSAGWGGNNTINEYSSAGVATGRTHSYSWNPSYGPGDAAFNWNTGKIWVMNIGTPNCIYEIDPATGPTGGTICPGGSSGFSISQRGLAYDPTTDTYYAGGWNDSMIYHFKSDGTILSSVNTGLPIAGLAYNPDTQHLFMMPSSTTTAVYVLDAANNYAVLGQFPIGGGFTSNGGGAGIELGCDGSLWVVDQVTQVVYQVTSGESTSVCSQDVPWLSESPITGTLASPANQSVNIAFDASQVNQPGQYHASLLFAHDTPYVVANVPVTLTVTAPPTWGNVHGRVYSQGYCDNTPSVLSGAKIELTYGAGLSQTMTQTGDPWNWWAAAGPLTITVSAPNHITQTVKVNVLAGQGVNQDVNLRWLHNCGSVTPASISLSVLPNVTRTIPISLTNTGAVSWTWSLTKTSGTWLSITGAVTGTTPPDGNQLSQLFVNTAGMVGGNTYTGLIDVIHDDDLQTSPIEIRINVLTVRQVFLPLILR